MMYPQEQWVNCCNPPAMLETAGENIVGFVTSARRSDTSLPAWCLVSVGLGETYRSPNLARRLVLADALVDDLA